MALTITRAGLRRGPPCCALRADGDRIGSVIALDEEWGVASTSLEAAELVVPASRDEAVKGFGDGSGVTVFGGGTILMAEINYGRLRPVRVLMLRDAGLSGIDSNGSGLTIGAMTTIAELEDALEPLGSAARNVADHEIRAQATLGGNLCARSGGGTPRGDLQAALIALAATVKSAGKDGERTEPVEDFLAADGAARGARHHEPQGRLQPGRLRRVHGPGGRRSPTVVPGAAGGARRRLDHDGRRPRRGGRPLARSGGVQRALCGPVRLLHVWFRHGRHRTDRTQPQGPPRGHPRGSVRPRLPVHRLRQDRRRGRGGRQGRRPSRASRAQLRAGGG